MVILTLILFFMACCFIPPWEKYNVCTADTMVLGLGSTVYVSQKQFWIIAVLGWYSMMVFFFIFPWAAAFSNTVNTMKENKNS